MDFLKTILHLCAKQGSDSLPYREAGYNVILVTEEMDVRKYIPPKSVHGIIANPPCTDLAGSGARWWKKKGEAALLKALSMCDACLRIVWLSNPSWWMLENPVGRLSKFYGEPLLRYHPFEYGDPYTKKTCVWGKFNIPVKRIVKPTEGSKMHLLPPSENRADLRSECSPGFARSFFTANP